MIKLEEVKIGDEIFWYDNFQIICSGTVQGFKLSEQPDYIKGVQLEKSFLSECKLLTCFSSLEECKEDFKHTYGKHLKELLDSVKKQESYLKDQLWSLEVNSEISIVKEINNA